MQKKRRSRQTSRTLLRLRAAGVVLAVLSCFVWFIGMNIADDGNDGLARADELPTLEPLEEDLGPAVPATEPPPGMRTASPTVEPSIAPEIDYESAVTAAILERNASFGRVAASVENSAWIEGGIAHVYGNNSEEQCNTSAWPEVVMIRLGNSHAIGLTTEGTLVFAGSNAEKQCALKTDGLKVRSVAASSFASYAVLEDGTVRMSGESEITSGDLAREGNVLTVAASDTHVVLLKADGTLSAYGDNLNGECDVSEWRDIVMADCGYGFTIAVDIYGTVHMTGSSLYGQDALNGLTGIRAVAAGVNGCLAIDTEGHVRAAGPNGKGQLDVGEWENAEAIAAGYMHTVGVTYDGARLTAGSDSCGQLGNR